MLLLVMMMIVSLLLLKLPLNIVSRIVVVSSVERKLLPLMRLLSLQ
jgi:hypothetical protein